MAAKSVKKRNPQDAYQIQIRAVKKRCTNLEEDVKLLVDKYNQLYTLLVAQKQVKPADTWSITRHKTRKK